MRRAALILLALAGLCLPRMALAEDLQVSAAISMRDALKDLVLSYKNQSPKSVIQVNLASSGAMVAQLKNGSPSDLFISAAEKQMDDLQTAGLIVADTRAIIAGNTLVLVIPAKATFQLKAFADLKNADCHKIAIGEPRTVPAGAYAVDTLNALNLFTPLQPKLVYGANVRQVLAYVERGEVDAGLVYKTDAQDSAAANDKVIIAVEAPAESHKQIVYPAAVTTNAAHPDEARKFLAFLRSADGQKIFAKHGFLPPPTPATAPATAP